MGKVMAFVIYFWETVINKHAMANREQKEQKVKERGEKSCIGPILFCDTVLVLFYYLSFFSVLTFGSYLQLKHINKSVGTKFDIYNVINCCYLASSRCIPFEWQN